MKWILSCKLLRIKSGTFIFINLKHKYITLVSTWFVSIPSGPKSLPR